MQFTKPINREVEIDGHQFIVSFDITGIEFRLKGKRKTARVDWPQVLDNARGEDGASARELLGVGASAPVNGQAPQRLAPHEDALARTINPPAPQSQPDGSAQEPPSSPASTSDESSPDAPSPAGETTEPGDEPRRALTAGETGPES